MHIYEIKLDTRNFQHLETKPGVEIPGGLVFDATSRKKWRPLPVQPVNLHLEPPDFWSLGVDSGAFAVNARAADQMAMFLEMAGELLPLQAEQELTLCNVLVCTDCVDEETSQWQLDAAGKRMAMVKPDFFPRCIPLESLFKIPQLDRKIYCGEISEDPEEEFRACVLENGLKGIQFELAWKD